jgi:hypothetical protein
MRTYIASGIDRLIHYLMRVRDFRRFGFTDVLNIPGVVDEEDDIGSTILYSYLRKDLTPTITRYPLSAPRANKRETTMKPKAEGTEPIG